MNDIYKGNKYDEGNQVKNKRIQETNTKRNVQY